MAYRYEKTDSGQDLVITFGEGIGLDPYSGPNRLNQVDLSVPGEVAVGFPITTSSTSGVTLGKPISRATKIQGGAVSAYYILDDTGHVFSVSSYNGTWTYLSNNATLTGASSLDAICFFSYGNSGGGYLFKFRNTSIDYWDGSVWVNGWKSITGACQHYAISGQDQSVYFCNNSAIGSILQNAGQTFDPTNVATYTFNTSALVLPNYDQAQSIAEQSTNLLTGGSLNAIYPWDRLSTSYTFPIFLAENYIKRMVTANTTVYIFAGNTTGRGRIYVTNGTNANLFFKIPDYITGQQDPYFEWGDAMWHRNSLVFGFFAESNSSSVLLLEEVWAIDLDTNVYGNPTESSFRSVSSISSATGKAKASVLIPIVNTAVPGFGYIVAWDDNGTTPGIGYSGTAAGTGSASIISDLIPIGTFLNKATNVNTEYKLRSPLQSGESITITPVVDGTNGTALTFSPTPTTGIFSGVAPVTWQGAQWLQFQVAMTGNNASSGVRLREIRIHNP